jgi:hypothetical protein
MTNAASDKATLINRLRAGEGGPSILNELERMLAGGVSRTPEDAELLLAYAHQAWIADQREPQATRARDAAATLASLIPGLQDAHRLLGLAHLSRGDYREAFMALTTAERTPGPMNVGNFTALARNLMLGQTTTSFEIAGQQYSFDLSCHNAAAIEAGAFHSVGVLTEWDELTALAETAGGRAIQTIVEIGVLMGNHTAFLLKTFKPSRLTLVDADPANLPFIRSTVKNNALTEPHVKLVNAFVGAGGPAISFAGAQVAQVTLKSVEIGTPDLIKIDVDGAEMQVLSHAPTTMLDHKPIIMIETTPRTRADVQVWFRTHGYEAVRSFDHGGYANTIWRASP